MRPEYRDLRINMLAHSGLGSLIIKAVEARLRHPHGNMEVNWTGKHRFYNIPVGVNLFDVLFVGPKHKAGEDPMTWEKLMPLRAGNSFIGATMLHPQWSGYRLELNRVWREQFLVRPDILASVPDRRDFVGAVYRVEAGVAKEQMFGAVPPISSFADLVDEEAEGRPIWMCAHARESRSYFKRRWGDRVMFDPGLTCTTGGEAPHAGQDVAHVENALREILTLASCAKLVHGVSSMATVALVVNPMMPHRFTQWSMAPLTPVEHQARRALPLPFQVRKRSAGQTEPEARPPSS